MIARHNVDNTRNCTRSADLHHLTYGERTVLRTIDERSMRIFEIVGQTCHHSMISLVRLQRNLFKWFKHFSS